LYWAHVENWNLSRMKHHLGYWPILYIFFQLTFNQLPSQQYFLPHLWAVPCKSYCNLSSFTEWFILFDYCRRCIYFISLQLDHGIIGFECKGDASRLCLAGTRLKSCYLQAFSFIATRERANKKWCNKSCVSNKLAFWHVSTF
jgi:hypothetical protein